MITYNIEIATLLKKAEHLRQRVEQLSITWLGQGYINTTVSIGIAMVDYYTKNWDELVKRADGALYRVKHEDGNNVEAELHTSS